MSVNIFIQCSQFVIVAEYERQIKLAQESTDIEALIDIKKQFQNDEGLAVRTRHELLEQLVFKLIIFS